MQKYNKNGRSGNWNNKKDWKGKKKRRPYREKPKGLAVVPFDDESPDSMIRRFRRIVDNAGVMRELKKREYYLTKSEKKREKRKRAAKRLRKQERKSRRYEQD